MNSLVYQVCSLSIQLLDRNKKKPGRPEKLRKYDYLKEILYVLRTGIQWNQLRGKLHWSTYYKKFCKWAKHGIFSSAFELVQKVLKRSGFLNENSYKTMYVDATMVKNVKGTDLVGINHYDRGRKGSKMSLLVSKEGIPLNLKMVSANVHDLRAFQEQIKTIKIKFVGSRIIGDKGYSSKDLKKTLKKNHISLITPTKKNQKSKNSSEEKEALKVRNLIENVFSWVQQRRRIRLRYEVKSIHYLEFYYLCLIEIIVRKKIILKIL